GRCCWKTRLLSVDGLTMPTDMRRACMQQNEELYCYLVTKISWKGSYKRLLTIGTVGITTYNKDTLRVTNQWRHDEVLGVRPDSTVKPSQSHLQRLVLTLSDTNRKRQEMTFASEYRVDVLTDLLRVPAIKLGWSERVTNLLLCASPISLDQIDPSSGIVLKGYLYRDIEYLDRHVFTVQNPDQLIKAAGDLSQAHLGLVLRRSPTPLTRDYCREFRLGKGSFAPPFSYGSSEDEFTSQAEFVVQKVGCRRESSTLSNKSRLLCITDSFLLERDPLSYRAVSAYPLCEIHALVRDRSQPQQFFVEDALLASLLDAVRASGNRDVCVRSTRTNRGLRFCPNIVSPTEEVESVHLRFLRQQPEGISFWAVLQRFNANVAYSGLLHAVTQDGVFAENKERLIKDALSAILTQAPPGMDTSLCDSLPGVGSRPMKKGSLQTSDPHAHLVLLEAQFHALRRLVASKAGFMAFTQLPGMRVTLGRIVVNALRRGDDAVTHAVLDAINTLMQPMHDSPDIRQEQLNKASIMSSEAFMSRLVDIFTLHALRGTGALVLCALLDFFTFAICLPYSETSEGGAFDCMLRLVANRGRALFRLFHHPSLAIVRGAGMVMRAMIEEGGDEVAREMRQLALSEGALFHHLSIACFTQGKDTRSLAVRQLSRHLVALWVDQSPEAHDLLKRMFPLGLLAFLESEADPPVTVIDHLPNRDNLQMAQDHMTRVEERKQTIRYQMEMKIDNLLTHWRLRVGLPPPKPNLLKELEERPVVLRVPRHQLRPLIDANDSSASHRTNWRYFFYQFDQDHAKPDLIWNLRTRNEMRESMEKELQEFKRERDYFAQSVMETVDYGLRASTSEESIGNKPISSTEKSDAYSSEPCTPTTNVMNGPSFTSHSEGSPPVSRANSSNPPTPPSSPTRTTADRLIAQASLVSWNHSEFKVDHPSLAGEPRVGNYYLRLLLEEDKRVHGENATIKLDEDEHDERLTGLSRIRDSKQFFNDLFRRYLQYIASGPSLGSMAQYTSTAATRGTRDSQQRAHRLAMRCLCLHAMAVVYGRCHLEIGPVSDIPLLVYLLDRTTSAPERDCLLLLLNKLMLNKYNVDALVEADGVRVLVDLACLSHLHTSRASTPLQSNVLKASAAQDAHEGGASTQREWWWYAPSRDPSKASDASGAMQLHGPVSFIELRKLVTSSQISGSTPVYAQGLDAVPRCRPDGFLAADDEEDAEWERNQLVGMNGASSGGGDTVTSSTGTGQKPGGSRSLSGWVLARRVVQLRWTIPELLCSTQSSPVSDLQPTSTTSSAQTQLTIGTEGVGSLVDQLGYSQGALLNYTQLAIRCVDVLRKLCDSCSSRDPHGGVVRPLPKPRRVISNPLCLTHLTQLLLTFDPPLVERVVSLLHVLLDQNPVLPRLYLTGVFFFVLMYTGSNVLPIARFLKDVHLLQAFRLEDAHRLSSTDLTSRSILGNMLPDAMIAYLDNHPPEKFAEIFLGNFDSPEAIWNSEMRRYLIERIASHLADFTPRLHSNTRAIYQYIGIPLIVYPQLENELFCHNYYLRHLCDTSRFPDWPIRDPIALLRDVLRVWREEIEKKPVDMSFNDAIKELGLDVSQLNPSNEEALIRRAYYQMSMKYHPDKNPEGRVRTRSEKFHAATVAYQFLCNRSKLGTGPNRLHIQLMLRVQSIVYSRYRSLLSAQKYAGYPMLVQTIRAETEDEDLFARVAASEDFSVPRPNTPEDHHESKRETAENAVLLVAAAELAYETVATSALNAEELRRQGGIQVLQEAFIRCSVIISRINSRPTDATVRVCGHIISVMAAASQFASCRQSIQELPQLAKHVLRLLYYRNLPQLCCLATACTSAFCTDYWLCVACYENGGLYLLLRHVFAYDFTLEEGGVETTESTNEQVITNRLALLCLWALGRLLNGYQSTHEVTEDSHLREGPAVHEALSRLLTPHLTRKIAELAFYDPGSDRARAQTTNTESRSVSADPPVIHDFPLDTPRGKYLRSLAKLLTTNSVTPYLIWDNRCRAELEVMLDASIERIIKTGECDLDAASRFVHSTYAHELLIGEVFVRLYNKQPSYQLENPKSFAIDLLRFLAQEVPNLTPQAPIKADLSTVVAAVSTEPQTSTASSSSLLDLDDIDWAAEEVNISDLCVSRLSAALEALGNVIHHNTGVELQCIGHFALLFSVMELHGYPDLQTRAIEVIQAVSTNNECLSDIAASQLLASMVLLFPSLPQCHQLLVETFDRLVMLTTLLKEFVYCGGLIYLLEIISRSPARRVREAVVCLLSRCLADKQVGRRIQALLSQFLPPIFAETLRDTPEAFINLFDSDHENPELIWNSEFREQLSNTVARQSQDFYANQLQNPKIRWSLPDSFSVSYADVLMKAASERLRTGSVDSAREEEEELMATLGPLVIAGVYLHLYVASPGWVLRRPELFLDSVLDTWIETVGRLPGSTLLLRLLTRACATVLADRPGLLDALPRKGYLHRIIDLLTSITDPEGAKAAVLLLHRMSMSKLCVQAMADRDTIGGLLRVVNCCIGEELGLVGETLFGIFDSPDCDPLVAQALKHDLIGYALQLLHNGLPRSVKEPGQTCAYLVKALKAMQRSPTYGAKVTERLNAHPNWADYRDQGHALFLSNVPSSATAYLTAGPSAGSLHAGYLTAATTTVHNTTSHLAPPPLPITPPAPPS
ncbi:DnaJ subfamily C member 13, partial [Paragonimus westermani]